MKTRLFICLAICCSSLFGQNRKPQVLTLGTFHFSFRNLDVQKTALPDQIDVLQPKYQKEIHAITNKLAAFKPTMILIERVPEKQHYIDSLYNSYRNGTYQLGSDEIEQIGFRLAKMFNLKTLYCVNDWGANYEYIDTVLAQKNDPVSKHFLNYFTENPDIDKIFYPEPLFKTKGILADLRNRNEEKNQQKDLGNYLIGVFKYQTENNPYFGTDFTSGWWFNRNLRIFRNIQKINAKPTDRILIIFGAGHMNLLNIFFKVSPEYRLQNISNFLK